MKSMYHTNATTAEELRQEILSDLDRRLRAGSEDSKNARNIPQRAAVFERNNLLAELLHFWTNIVIDP